MNLLIKSLVLAVAVSVFPLVSTAWADPMLRENGWIEEDSTAVFDAEAQKAAEDRLAMMNDAAENQERDQAPAVYNLEQTEPAAAPEEDSQTPAADNPEQADPAAAPEMEAAPAPSPVSGMAPAAPPRPGDPNNPWEVFKVSHRGANGLVTEYTFAILYGWTVTEADGTLVEHWDIQFPHARLHVVAPYEDLITIFLEWASAQP